jgi:F-type H+-transporting ATPase subunit a
MTGTTEMLGALQHTALPDTLQRAAHGSEAAVEQSVFGELLHHLQDSHVLDVPFVGPVALPRFAPLHLGGVTIDLSITKHVVFLWLAALVVVFMAVVASRANARRKVPRGFGNLMEIAIVFIRDEIALPNMGPAGAKYLPYLLTTFLLILVMNVMGLVPYLGSSTSNVSVTGGLALVAFIMIQWAAIRARGLKHYLAHLTGGVHWSLWGIMIPIEILGLFTKPFALCVRLFANMTGGHIVIVSLIGLIFLFHSYLIAVAPAGFVVGIMFLELLVAFLQAYIFVMLTAVFMGLGMQSEDGAGHG